jgi:hypothetical protein
VVAARYDHNRRLPSTARFRSLAAGLGDESELFRGLAEMKAALVADTGGLPRALAAGADGRLAGRQRPGPDARPLSRAHEHAAQVARGAPAVAVPVAMKVASSG